MVSATGTPAAKKASAPKKTAAPAHPPYVEMVKEALLALKERTGSSHYAIAKHIEENQKAMPSNFKKLLSVQLKRLVVSGKLVKVKNSFKIAPVEKKSSETKPTPKAAKPKVVKDKKVVKKTVKKAAPAKAKPVKKTVAKPKTLAKTVTKTVVKSPAKKVVASKAKKVVEKAKKPKSIKSPAKKMTGCKRGRK